MVIYLLNFISIPIYDLLFKKAKSKKRIIIFLASLQLFLILSLRWELLGVDLETYKIHFDYYKTMPFSEVILGFRPIGGSAHAYGMESGYVLFNWIIGKLGFSFHSFLVIYAAVIVISLAVFMDRYCEDVALGYAAFMSIGGFLTLFGILRQSLAVAVFLFAMPALVKRNFKKYLLIVFLAGLFHQSILIAIFLYPLAAFKADRFFYTFVISASLLLVVFTPTVYTHLIFPILAKLEKYYYMSDFTWNNMFAVMLLFAILIMAFFKKQKKSDNAMLCGYAMAIPIQALAFYLPVFSRLSGSVFMNFLCILIPGTVYSFETRSQRLQAKTVVYAGLSAFYVYILLVDEVLVPYIPFWAVG